MLGVSDQDLRRLEAWLGNHRRLAGVIRAVIAGPPPQAHCHGRGWGEHLARPRRGAMGRVVHQPPQGVNESCTYEALPYGRGRGSSTAALPLPPIFAVLTAPFLGGREKPLHVF
jgi:hypothetical protein